MASQQPSASKLLAEISKSSHAVDKIFRSLEDDAAKTAAARAEEIQQRKRKMEARRAEVERSVAAEREAIAEDRKRFDEEKARMSQILAVQKEKVTLDVGGNRFSTAMATLRSIEGSRFDDFFSGELEPDEDDGSYFIDRDGRHFHLLLEFLRSPDNFEMPTSAAALTELKKEAKFYRVELPSSVPAKAQPASQQTPTAVTTSTASEVSKKPSLSVVNEATSHPEAYQQGNTSTESAQAAGPNGKYFRESWYGNAPTPDAGGQPTLEPERTKSEAMVPLSSAPDVFDPTPPINKFANGPPPLSQPPAISNSAPAPVQPAVSAATLFGGGSAAVSNAPSQPGSTSVITAPPPLASSAHTQSSGYGQSHVAPPPSMYQPGPPPVSAVTAPAQPPGPPTFTPSGTAPPPLANGHGFAPPQPVSQAPPVSVSMYAPPQPVSQAPPMAVPESQPATNSYTSSQWGSAQLSTMPVAPMSQPARNKLRGWNDPPKMTQARSRPAAAPPVQAITAPIFGSAASQAPQQAAHTAASAVTAPAPEAAPAPTPVQEQPVRKLVLPDYAKVMQNSLQTIAEKCRAGNASMQNKVKGIETKLDPFYESIADGSIDASVVDQVSRLAGSLLAGNHAAALQDHKNLTQAHIADDIGAKIMPLKSLISLVKQRVDRKSW